MKTILLAVLFASTAAASPCRTAGTTIYFGNGILTPRQNARIALYELRARIDSALKVLAPMADPSCINYELAYDSEFLTAGGSAATVANAILQIGDAAIQLGLTDETSLWTKLFSGNIFGALPQGWGSLGSKYFNLLASVVGPVAGDLPQHVNAYNVELNSLHNNVITVAHSQGNLYANAAYKLVSQPVDRRLSIVAVASPADHVEGGGSHVTLLNDIILLVPQALPWTTQNTNTPDRCTSLTDLASASRCHEFLASYLLGDVSEPSIISAILSRLTENGTIPAPGWPQFGHDAMQTSNTASAAPILQPSQISTIDAGVRNADNLRIASDGSIIVHDLIKLTINNYSPSGALKWSVPALTGGTDATALAVGPSGTVYEARNRIARALSATSGSVIWTYDLPLALSDLSTSPLLIGPNETALVHIVRSSGFPDSTVVALNANGTLRWQRSDLASSAIGIGTARQLLYASLRMPDSNVILVGLSLEDGSTKVEAVAMDPIRYFAAVAPWGRVIGFTATASVTCLPDLTECLPFGGPGEDFYYLVSASGSLATYSNATGAVYIYDANGVYQRSFDGTYISGPIDANGWIIYNDRQRVVASDAVTGAIKWSLNIKTTGPDYALPHPNGCLIGLLVDESNRAYLGSICP